MNDSQHLLHRGDHIHKTLDNRKERMHLGHQGQNATRAARRRATGAIKNENVAIRV